MNHDQRCHSPVLSCTSPAVGILEMVLGAAPLVRAVPQTEDGAGHEPWAQNLSR